MRGGEVGCEVTQVRQWGSASPSWCWSLLREPCQFQALFLLSCPVCVSSPLCFYGGLSKANELLFSTNSLSFKALQTSAKCMSSSIEVTTTLYLLFLCSVFLLFLEWNINFPQTNLKAISLFDARISMQIFVSLMGLHGPSSRSSQLYSYHLISQNTNWPPRARCAFCHYIIVSDSFKLPKTFILIQPRSFFPPLMGLV